MTYFILNYYSYGIKNRHQILHMHWVSAKKMKIFCYLKQPEMIDDILKGVNFQWINAHLLPLVISRLFSKTLTFMILLKDVYPKKWFNFENVINNIKLILYRKWAIENETDRILSEKFNCKSILDSIETTIEINIIKNRFVLHLSRFFSLHLYYYSKSYRFNP